MKKILSLLLAVILLLSLSAVAFAANKKPLEDKLIILFTNDIHGRAEHTETQVGYSGIAQAKKNLIKSGAEVYLFDAGDAFQGAPIVNMSQGAEAVEFMNLAGYDAACPGNHEFDWGVDNFLQKIEEADFPYVCANIVDSISEESKLDSYVIIGDGDYKIGVFGVDTPEAKTKTNPDKVKGIDILTEEELFECAQTQVDALKEEGVQLIVCLGHLGDADETEGNRSIDLLDNVEGIDLFIDAHSHTYLATGSQQGDTLRVSTGCHCKALGYVIYDKSTDDEGNVSLELNKTGLFDAGSIESIMAFGDEPEVDKDTDEYVEAVKLAVETELGETFAESEVYLNGERAPGVRTEETNLGDLCADAMLWEAQQAYSDNVVAAVIQGGGIRQSIETGEISMLDMKSVFPFGNTLACLDISGADLLEALEAGSFTSPDPIGGFPQVSGIEYTIDTTVAFEQGEQYPDSTYYAPKNPGARITIETIGGEPFDPDAIYTIATSDFLAAGGDQYYIMRYSYKTAGVNTGIALEDALVDYITEVLEGKIGEDYAEPQGRITIIK